MTGNAGFAHCAIGNDRRPSPLHFVIPAKAGIHNPCQRQWIPAFAGMTDEGTPPPARALGSKLNQEIDVTEPILVSGKARGRRDA
jgi:hypothetical protein